MAKRQEVHRRIKRYDREQLHSLGRGARPGEEPGAGQFDETVELAVRLGVDPRKADQMVRGTVALPSGTGTDVRVAVFAPGEAATEARAAGADFVGADDLAAEVEGGMLDFDVAIATPDLMPQVGKLGRVLGPRGLMPNPKTGTVTTDVGKAVTDFKGGKVEYRTDRYGNVHVPLGKASFEAQALAANYRPSSTSWSGPSRRRPRAATSSGSPWLDHGPGHQGRPQPHDPRRRDRRRLGRRPLGSTSRGRGRLDAGRRAPSRGPGADLAGRGRRHRGSGRARPGLQLGCSDVDVPEVVTGDPGGS